MTATERLGIEDGGWVRWMREGFGFPDSVRIRFRPSAADRLVAVEVSVADEGGVGADALRLIPVARLERWVNSPEVATAVRERLTDDEAESPELKVTRRKVSPKISVPERRGRAPYPDSFYRRVSDAVSAGWSARAIAEASGVPDSTVTRWIKGARERGFLARTRREAKGGRDR